MKRSKTLSAKASYKLGGFEAGLVKGSAHPRNNVYLKIYRAKEKAEFDLTVDEAAAIVHVLGAAIMDWTHDKRDELSPRA